MKVPVLLRNRRHGGNRFITCSEADFIRLFGYPPPLLPQGERTPDGGEVLQVTMPSELETFSGRYLYQLRSAIRERREPGSPGAGDDVESDYVSCLEGLIRHVALSDRRMGLLNLFWLSHAKSLSAMMQRLYPPGSGEESAKHRAATFLCGLLRRSQTQALAGLSPARKRAVNFNLGRGYNWGIFEAIVADQLPLTEPDVRHLVPGAAFGEQNLVFRMGGAAFQAVVEELERAFGEAVSGDDPDLRRLLARSGLAFPAATEHGRRLNPLLFDDRVLRHHLSGADTARRLQDNKHVNYLCRKLGGWGAFTQEFEQVILALRRAEYVQFFQDSVSMIPPGFDESDIKGPFLAGRLYKYSAAMPVVSSFKNVVIVFADIREFTRTSEKAISERELAERLYNSFDPLVHIVTSLGGTVDKFTGDGMMVTFGAVGSISEAPLRGLRCAIAIQEAVEKLRRGGKTEFRMGLSLHWGRVCVADFMHDDRQVETTVIGRQVNLASRVSSTKAAAPPAGEPGDDAVQAPGARLPEALPSDPSAVSMDSHGNFFNVGLATTSQFIRELQELVEMEPFKSKQASGFRYRDSYLKSEVIFHYVGAARFKGFGEAVPVYGVSWTRAEPGKERR